ncbi:DNA alkylation repair protein [Carboxylicivirga marina]|uniref:DNA alkylation repair protein n=1 Tax=Carboxylicivirga marina TaxID=2800988 RepID=A0ABS1HFE5_9BACT|nr:DNA alkylation repair protein [Carboxylicivirga marina]MBK3516350.1 DNA alkylation repair protein [Carboxylicivirga marina]
MTAQEILKQLEAFGNEQTKSVLIKHGAKEPFFGVKVQDLKKILKQTKKNHELSLELYATGNSDAMYLAGLMADEKQITKENLNEWVNQAYWYYLSEYAVPWVAAETPFGFDLGLEWIESDIETTAAAGWATLSNYAAVNADDVLNINKYSKLLDFVENNIHLSPNRVRYTMNGFVIAVGTYIESLTSKSQQIAQNIGKVKVDVGGTACKVPLASDYITKVINKGNIGKKRKTARC